MDLDDYIVDALDEDEGDGLHEGDLLIHILLPDLLRFAVEAFHDGRRVASLRLLSFIDFAFSHSDHDVWEAIAVSFVEDVGVYSNETPEFIATWPPGLREELDRQNDPFRDKSLDPEPPPR